MEYTDIYLHVRGASQFVDDLPTPSGMLHAAIYASPISHGRILEIDAEGAERMIGVKAVFTAAHIPGDNQIGNIIQDECLLAEDSVHYWGQPIAVVVAETPEITRRAVHAIVVKIDPLPAIYDARQAFRAGQLIIPPRIFRLGHVEKAWRRCDLIVEGQVESGAQEHVYMEPQSALAIPLDDGGLKVYSATQSPTAVQRNIARILNVPMHLLEVEVPRIGGGFGGKEDQATAYAAMTALAAYRLKRPVKLVLHRSEDMRFTGKRHPYSSDFKIGLAKNGKIMAYEVTFYQNAGAAADLSTAILDRTLFHTTNSYYIPNVTATGYCCRTNLPPFTAFRGFGAPQAMFVLECAIHKAAEKMCVEPHVIQEKNLIRKGQTFPYGMRLGSDQPKRAWKTLQTLYRVADLREQQRSFNEKNRHCKKGMAIMPVCFGISFTNTMLNQASALVHVYSDGSVSVSTAAVEMGQGVNEKIRHIVARVLGIDLGRVKVEHTNTTRNANTSPTAASTGPDLNGHATRIACETIRANLLKVAAQELKTNAKNLEIRRESVFSSGKKTQLKWSELVAKTYAKRLSLSAHAHYATPKIFFDTQKNKGRVFAYHVCGCAVVEATVDCLRGTYRFDAVRIVHDVGQSLAPLIDLGQIEGGVVQGLGWMTMEEVIYNHEGKLTTNNLSTYKVPDIYFAPEVFTVRFMEPRESNKGLAEPISGPFQSKAVGEPPFMYGIAGYFALIVAMKAFQPKIHIDYVAPMTPERVLMALYPPEGNR